MVPPVKIGWKRLEGPRGPTWINQHRTPRSTRKRWIWSPTFRCPSLFVRSSVWMARNEICFRFWNIDICNASKLGGRRELVLLVGRYVVTMTSLLSATPKYRWGKCFICPTETTSLLQSTFQIYANWWILMAYLGSCLSLLFVPSLSWRLKRLQTLIFVKLILNLKDEEFWLIQDILASGEKKAVAVEWQRPKTNKWSRRRL